MKKMLEGMVAKLGETKDGVDEGQQTLYDELLSWIKPWCESTAKQQAALKEQLAGLEQTQVTAKQQADQESVRRVAELEKELQLLEEQLAKAKEGLSSEDKAAHEMAAEVDKLKRENGDLKTEAVKLQDGQLIQMEQLKRENEALTREVGLQDGQLIHLSSKLSDLQSKLKDTQQRLHDQPLSVSVCTCV